MTTRELAAVCLVWQRRLRISDWRIKVEFVSAKKIPGRVGSIVYDRAVREASICIRKKAPIEPTLVHELGHLLMPDITPENETGIEAAIDSYTEALIAAYDS
jgi:hypothetical protein